MAEFCPRVDKQKLDKALLAVSFVLALPSVIITPYIIEQFYNALLHNFNLLVIIALVVMESPLILFLINLKNYVKSKNLASGEKILLLQIVGNILLLLLVSLIACC